MEELVTLTICKIKHEDSVFCFCYFILGASLVAQWRRIHLSVQAIRFRFLSREDPLEKAMATHSSVLAWEIPWTEEIGGLQSMGLQNSQTQLSDKIRTM